MGQRSGHLGGAIGKSRTSVGVFTKWVCSYEERHDEMDIPSFPFGFRTFLTVFFHAAQFSYGHLGLIPWKQNLKDLARTQQSVQMKWVISNSGYCAPIYAKRLMERNWTSPVTRSVYDAIDLLAKS